MLAVGPAMDGEFPQHEPPPAGSILYSPPPLQTPLCGSSVQVSAGHPRVGLGVGCYPWGSSCSLPFQGLERMSQPPALQGGRLGGAQLPLSLTNMSYQVGFAKVMTSPQGDAQAWAASSPAGQGLAPS